MRANTRFAALLAAGLVAAPIAAATPEDAYIAARDAAIAEIKAAS